MLPQVLCVALALGLGMNTAEAALYRCVDGGKVTFTDRPCAAFAPQFKPATTLIILPAGPSRDLAADYDARIAQGRAARDRADGAFIGKQQARRATEDAVHRARVERKVVRGMTPTDVRRAAGAPTRVVRSDGPGGARERWSYQSDSGRQTVTLQRGEVITVSATTSSKSQR